MANAAKHLCAQRSNSQTGEGFALDELEVFVAVVADQGFSAAAKRLETTPGAVSRRIKALEQRLGVRLLQRTTRKVQLTEAGELYHHEVTRLLAIYVRSNSVSTR